MSAITNEYLKVKNESAKEEVQNAIQAAATQGDDAQALLEKFLKASDEATTLATEPSNDDKLKLYAFYKRGLGVTNMTQPGMFDFVGKKKYQAWVDVGDIPASEAQTQYIELVEKLK
ncbi:Enoyl-CoA delta isomerase 2, mitochondrial [Coemansia sp. Benny D115]|nr:Enoyl-CoA delta isomerase 2, mitochondrial [Coemansia sp. Benny D115]